MAKDILQRYEYKTEYVNMSERDPAYAAGKLQEKLNFMAQGGWKLVGTVPVSASVQGITLILEKMLTDADKNKQNQFSQTGSHSLYEGMRRVPIIAGNVNTPFRPVSVLLGQREDKWLLSLQIEDVMTTHPAGIEAEMDVMNSFEEVFTIQQLSFIHFRMTEKGILTSEPCIVEAPGLRMQSIESIDILITRYVDDTGVVVPESMELFNLNEEEEEEQIQINMQELIQILARMSSAADMEKYLKELDEEQPDCIPYEVLEEVSKSTAIERLYGNMKQDCLKKVQQILKELG